MASNKNYSLDLVFSSLKGIKNLNTLLRVDNHHPPSVLIVRIKCGKNIEFNISYRNFRKADYENINKELSNMDWPTIMHNRSCDNKVEKFYNINNDLIERIVSRKTS